jgi:hypothetical protein
MAVLTKVYLGDSLITELDENKTATILTKKRKAPKDIRIYFGVPGTVEYDGVLNEVLSGKTAILECKDKVLKTNVIIRTFEGEPYDLEPNAYGNTIILNIYTIEPTDDSAYVIVG